MLDPWVIEEIRRREREKEERRRREEQPQLPLDEPLPEEVPPEPEKKKDDRGVEIIPIGEPPPAGQTGRSGGVVIIDL